MKRHYDSDTDLERKNNKNGVGVRVWVGGA